MALTNIRAEFFIDDETFIGRADEIVGHGARRRVIPDRKMNILGCRIKTGSWQLYSVGYGTMFKIVLVKPQTIDFTHATHRAPEGSLPRTPAPDVKP